MAGLTAVFARMGRLRLAILALGLVTFLPGQALAQQVSLDFGQGSLSGTSIILFLLLTVLSLAPGLAVTITCFPLIVTVLSILRTGIGLPQSPPNILIVGLAMFLSFFVMEPSFRQSWEQGIQPAIDGRLAIEEAFEPTISPFRTFMLARTEPETYARLAALRKLSPDMTTPSLPVLIPAFLLSELARAFQIGFLVLLPFLIIDLVASAVLMSMGMMMMPPSIVALPFKLAFFVAADGWTLLSEALVKGYM